MKNLIEEKSPCLRHYILYFNMFSIRMYYVICNFLIRNLCILEILDKEFKQLGRTDNAQGEIVFGDNQSDCISGGYQ